MKTDEFKSWLQTKYPDSAPTVRNRISNCKTVENHHGDLDEYYKKDRCNALIEEFNYSADDEKENREQKHKVPIDGNIKNGSATLKSAIRLYAEFRECYDESMNPVTIDDYSQLYADSKHQPTFYTIVTLLKRFEYNGGRHKDIAILQRDICSFLNTEMGAFTWKIEQQPQKKEKEEKEEKVVKDRIDIFGESSASDLKVIIELDAHRADQVAKKFLSRSALMIDQNSIYLSVCYPGTEKMPKPECQKYFEYCSMLSKTLAKGSGKEKLYAGIFLH